MQGQDRKKETLCNAFVTGQNLGRLLYETCRNFCEIAELLLAFQLKTKKQFINSKLAATVRLVRLTVL